MPLMKAIRIALWSLVAVAASVLAWQTTAGLIDPAGEERAAGIASIGGPFEGVLSNVENPQGKPVTQADLVGRPHAIFFGFTNCPDVCPTTLYEATLWLKELGDEAGKLDVYFASVDPARDTPEQMAAYLTPFHERISAISGTEAQMAAMHKTWGVVAEKGEVRDGEYNVNHTATVFLMDARGRFFGTIGYGEDPKAAVAKLRRLLADGSATS